MNKEVSKYCITILLSTVQMANARIEFLIHRSFLKKTELEEFFIKLKKKKGKVEYSSCYISNGYDWTQIVLLLFNLGIGYLLAMQFVVLSFLETLKSNQQKNIKARISNLSVINGTVLFENSKKQSNVSVFPSIEMIRQSLYQECLKIRFIYNSVYKFFPAPSASHLYEQCNQLWLLIESGKGFVFLKQINRNRLLSLKIMAFRCPVCFR